MSRTKPILKCCPGHCGFQAGALWVCFFFISFFLAARGCTFFGKTLTLCPELGTLFLGAAGGVLLLSWKLTCRGKKKKEAAARRAEELVFHFLELKVGEDQFGPVLPWFQVLRTKDWGDYDSNCPGQHWQCHVGLANSPPNVAHNHGGYIGCI